MAFFGPRDLSIARPNNAVAAVCVAVEARWSRLARGAGFYRPWKTGARLVRKAAAPS
jgi:hypothetical protein